MGRLTTFVDSTGDADRFVWDALMPWMDAAMIDLKALDPAVHRYLTGRPNERVLASIGYLAGTGRLYEVRLLLVPGVNDGERMLARTADWLCTIDPTMRIKLIGFRRHGTRPVAVQLPEMTPSRLAEVRDLLDGRGLHNVVTV